MRQEPGKSEIHDGLCDEAIVEFLTLIDIVTAGITASMEVPDPLKIVTDIADDVAVHNLCVIDVVENFHSRRVDALHHIDSPSHVIKHIVLVVHAAVEQLHTDSD